MYIAGLMAQIFEVNSIAPLSSEVCYRHSHVKYIQQDFALTMSSTLKTS